MNAFQLPGLDGLLVGLILNGFFTGIMNAQVYMYFRKFPRDSSRLKLMVATLWTLQMLYLPISAIGAYYELISCQRNPLMLLEVKWETRYSSTQILLITAIAHIFFASRLWSYGNDLRVMVPLGALMTTNLAFGIFVGYRSYTDQFSSADPASLGHWSITVWNSLIVVTDSTISIYLSYLMMRKRSTIRSTNSIMKLVTLYGVTTGTVSTVIALTIVLAYKKAWYSGVALFGSCGPPINVCAVLTNLHMRSGLRSREARDTSIPTSFSIPGLNQLFRSKSQQIPGITVDLPPTTAAHGSHDDPADYRLAMSPVRHCLRGAKIATRGRLLFSIGGLQIMNRKIADAESISEGGYPMTAIRATDIRSTPT